MNKEQAILRLTDRQRQLIELRENQKLTWTKVGEAIGVGGQYAAQLHKAAVKELRQLEEVDEMEWKTPPQAVSAPTEAIPEPALEIPQVSPARKPLVAMATATSQPKVAWVTGVPMAVPRNQTPWSSVTLRK